MQFIAIGSELRYMSERAEQVLDLVRPVRIKRTFAINHLLVVIAQMQKFPTSLNTSIDCSPLRRHSGTLSCYVRSCW